VRATLLAALFVSIAPVSRYAAAQSQLQAPRINVAYEAPVGHRQPTVDGVAQAGAPKRARSAIDIGADEAVQRSERILRQKLIICRGC